MGERGRLCLYISIYMHIIRSYLCVYMSMCIYIYIYTDYFVPYFPEVQGLVLFSRLFYVGFLNLLKNIPSREMISDPGFQGLQCNS